MAASAMNASGVINTLFSPSRSWDHGGHKGGALQPRGTQAGAGKHQGPTADAVQRGAFHSPPQAAFQTSRRRIEFHLATRPETAFSANSGAYSGRSLATQHGSGAKFSGTGIAAPRAEGSSRHAGPGAEAQVEKPAAATQEGKEEQLTRRADEEIGLPPAEKGLCPESAVKRWLTWEKVFRVGPGLRNLGNTCFMNATLQCLAYLPPLAQHLLSGTHLKGCQKSRGVSWASPNGSRRVHGREIRNVDVLDMMTELLEQVHKGRLSGLGAISPRAFARNLSAIGRFRLGRQEDAHEFLREVLDSMSSTCLRLRGVKTSAPGRLAETTLMHRIFGGYLRSQLKCTSCGHTSNTFDPFMDLSLELSGGVRAIESAVRNFTSKEVLDGGNRWRCGGCQKLVRAEKRLTVFKPPNALVVQLKRFVFSGRGAKIKTSLRFTDELKLAVSGPQRGATFDLTGVVVHSGSTMSSGHYYAYVRGSSGMWTRMDDECVSKVKLQTVLSSEAYLLFYTRRRVAEATATRGPSSNSPLPPRLAPSPKGRSPFAGTTDGRLTPLPERTTPAQLTRSAPPSGARVISTWAAREGEAAATQAMGAKAADSGGAPAALGHGPSSPFAKLDEVPVGAIAPRGRKRAASNVDAVLGAASGGSEAAATGTGGREAIAPEMGARKRSRKGMKSASLPDDAEPEGASRANGGNGGFVASYGDPSSVSAGRTCAVAPASRDANPAGRARDGTTGEGLSREKEERAAGPGKGIQSSPALNDPGGAGPGRGSGAVVPRGTEGGGCAAGTGVGRDDSSTPRDSDKRVAGEARKEVTGEKVTLPWRPTKRNSHQLYGEGVGTWVDEAGDGGQAEPVVDAGGEAEREALDRLAAARDAQDGVVRRQAAEERKVKAARAVSAWDRCLDTGKLKKVKAKKAGASPIATRRAFDAKQRQIHGQRRRGFHGTPRKA